MSGIRASLFSAGRILVVRLAPKSDLLYELGKAVSYTGIESGLILSGVASLTKVTLRNLTRFGKFPITDEDRVLVAKEGDPIELLALTGNVSRHDGEPHIHAHATISSGLEKGKAHGGHLAGVCEVYSTGEVAIMALEGGRMVRRVDPETKGLELFFE